MTSHDVVAAVRRLIGQRSVGHAGTLDPLATGVLIVLIGRATRLSQYAMASRKTYWAEIVLGAATDTDDAEGSICRRAAIPVVSMATMSEALRVLTGSIMQTPPRFSAIKRDGQKAYVLARKGQTPEMERRPVTIHSIVIHRWTPPRLFISATTGPGTYIRSLARDIGVVLGSAAYLQTLVRTSSGAFHLNRSVAWKTITTGGAVQSIANLDTIVAHLPAVFLSSEDTVRIRQGIGIPAASHELPGQDQHARLYGDTGTLTAIGRLDLGRWHPVRVLEPAH